MNQELRYRNRKSQTVDPNKAKLKFYGAIGVRNIITQLKLEECEDYAGLFQQLIEKIRIPNGENMSEKPIFKKEAIEKLIALGYPVEEFEGNAMFKFLSHSEHTLYSYRISANWKNILTEAFLYQGDMNSVTIEHLERLNISPIDIVNKNTANYKKGEYTDCYAYIYNICYNEQSGVSEIFISHITCNTNEELKELNKSLRTFNDSNKNWRIGILGTSLYADNFTSISKIPINLQSKIRFSLGGIEQRNASSLIIYKKILENKDIIAINKYMNGPIKEKQDLTRNNCAVLNLFNNSSHIDIVKMNQELRYGMSSIVNIAADILGMPLSGNAEPDDLYSVYPTVQIKYLEKEINRLYTSNGSSYISNSILNPNNNPNLVCYALNSILACGYIFNAIPI